MSSFRAVWCSPSNWIHRRRARAASFMTAYLLLSRTASANPPEQCATFARSINLSRDFPQATLKRAVTRVIKVLAVRALSQHHKLAVSPHTCRGVGTLWNDLQNRPPVQFWAALCRPCSGARAQRRIDRALEPASTFITLVMPARPGPRVPWIAVADALRRRFERRKSRPR